MQLGLSLGVSTRSIGPRSDARNTVAPSFTGTPVAGNVQTGNRGSWDGAVAYEDQWHLVTPTTDEIISSGTTATPLVSGELRYWVRGQDAEGRWSTWAKSLVAEIAAAPPQTIPIITSVTYDGGADRISVNVDIVSTIFYIVNSSATPLTGAAIEALYAAGTPEAEGTFAAAEGNTDHNPNFDDVAVNVGRYLHITAKHSSGGYSTDYVYSITVVGSAAPAPVLSAISVDPAITTAELSWSTDTNNGTAWWMVSTNATRTAAQIKAGGGLDSGSIAVSASGAQAAILAEGLTAGVSTQYFHLVHTNSDGVDSTVSNTNFTTDAAFNPATTFAFYWDAATPTANYQEISSPTTQATADNDPIGTMINLGTLGGSIAAAGTGNRPLLGTDGNGKKYAVFDGTDDSLRGEPGTIVLSGGWRLFVVCDQDADASQTVVSIGPSTGTHFQVTNSVRMTTPNLYGFEGGQPSTANRFGVNQAGSGIGAFTLVEAVQKADFSAELFIAGASAGTSSAATAGVGNAGRIVLGAHMTATSTTSARFNGKIYAVGLFLGEMTAGQVTAARDHFNALGGL